MYIPTEIGDCDESIEHEIATGMNVNECWERRCYIAVVASWEREHNFGTKRIYQTAFAKQCNKYWAWPMADAMVFRERAMMLFLKNQLEPTPTIHSSKFVCWMLDAAWMHSLTIRRKVSYCQSRFFVEMSIRFEVFASGFFSLLLINTKKKILFRF